MYTMDRKEPFWWSIFAVGGVVAALLVPIHVFVDGLAVPLGLLDGEALGYERMRALSEHTLFKLYLFVLVVLPLYHAAHRMRFSLYELGVREFRISMALFCYGAAVIGTLSAAYILFRLL